MNIMNTKSTIAIVAAVVGLSFVTNAVMAQQAEAGKPRPEFQGPVKVFILAGQSNMSLSGQRQGVLHGRIQLGRGNEAIVDDQTVSIMERPNETDTHQSCSCPMGGGIRCRRGAMDCLRNVVRIRQGV
jgi:hypothetical protein